MWARGGGRWGGARRGGRVRPVDGGMVRPDTLGQIRRQRPGLAVARVGGAHGQSGTDARQRLGHWASAVRLRVRVMGRRARCCATILRVEMRGGRGGISPVGAVAGRGLKLLCNYAFMRPRSGSGMHDSKSGGCV